MVGVGSVTLVGLGEFKFELQRFAFRSDLLRSCIALLRGLVAEALPRS